MDMHTRLMNVSTSGITFWLNTLGDNRETTIREFVEKSNENIHNGTPDLETLEALRSALCYEYQSTVDSSSNANVEQSQSFSVIPNDFDRNFDVKSFFVKNDEYWSKEELDVLYDILVGQLVLRRSPQSFIKLFDDFYETQLKSLATSDETQNLCMRVSECFIDSFTLRSGLHKSSGTDNNLEKLCCRIKAVIKVWLRQITNIDWKLFTSLIPKLAVAFNPEDIVSFLWDEVVVEHEELGKTLSALYIMCDICFPCENGAAKEIHYEHCMQERFWLILLQGLLSGVSQHRKEAMYLMKRAVGFMDLHEPAIRGKLDPSKESIVPFKCARLPSADPSIAEMKKSFFLILEVLEAEYEIQKHSIPTTLSKLPILLQAYVDHKACGDCFTVAWLHCILQRIMQHDNNGIKKLGLEVTLKADLDVFNEAFLIFVANVLNNEFLYDCQPIEHSYEVPQIVEQLKAFFKKSWDAEVDLINAFICAISQISWGSIALFWITYSLAIDYDECSWRNVHKVLPPAVLRCVKTLVENHRSLDDCLLKFIFQHLILRRIRTPGRLRILSQAIRRGSIAHARPPLLGRQSDLMLIMDTLSVGVERPWGTASCWKNVICFIERNVEPSAAELFVTQICATFFEIERNKGSLAQFIALLVASARICKTNECPAEKALYNLFQNLVGADLSLYADTASVLEVLLFMSHLINFSPISNSSAIGLLRRLVLKYGDVIVKLVNRSLERKTIERCDIYLLAITALSNIPQKSLRKTDLDIEKQFERIEDKCIYIMCNPTDFSVTQWSYAIKALYLCRKRLSPRQTNPAITYIPPVLSYFNSQMFAKGHEEEAGKRSALPTGSFASDCSEAIAELIFQAITHSPLASWASNVHWFQALRSLVETGNGKTIKSVACTFDVLVNNGTPLAIQDLKTVHFIIREAWRRVFHMKRTPLFVAIVESLADLIIDTDFLKLDGNVGFASECAIQMMEDGDCVVDLKLAFLSAVRTLSPRDVNHFQKSLVSCLLHGPVSGRDQKIKENAIMAAQNAFHESYRDFLDNYRVVRIRAVIELLFFSLLPGASGLRRNVLTDLLDVLAKNQNKTYCHDSQLHRLKGRVMQTLLAMMDTLDTDELHELHHAICDLLIAERNQPSVRLMQEWLITRIHAKELYLRDSIWALFATAAEKRPESIVSLANIVFHTARMLRDQEQADYISKGIVHLLPNCLGSAEFDVRLHSQAILVKIFRILPADSSAANQYRDVAESVEESLRRGNLMKNSTGALDNFYYTDFHGDDCYNLWTIFYHLPRLTHVYDGEWVPQYFFETECDLRFGEKISYLFENSEGLDHAKAMMISTEATGDLAEDEADPAAEEGLNSI